MLTKFKLVAAALLVLFVGLPYGLGFVAEKQYQHLLTGLSEADVIQLQTVRYQRGWFRSEAISQVNLYASAVGLPQTLTLTFKHDIQHGPWVKGFGLARIVSAVVLTESEQALFDTVSHSFTPMQWVTRVGFFGGAHIHISSPAFEIRQQSDNAELLWQGFEGQWSLNKTFSKVEGQFKLPLLCWKVGAEEKLKIVDLSDHYDVAREDGVWVGEHQWQVGFLKIHDWQNMPELQVRVWHHNQSLAESRKGEMALQWEGRLESIYWDKELYGPVKWNIALDNITRDGLLTLRARLKEGYRPDGSRRVLSAWVDALPKVLNSRPILSIRQLDIDMPQGFLQAQAKIAVGGTPNVNIMRPETVMKSMEAEVHVAASKSLVQSILETQNARKHAKPLQVPLIATYTPAEIAQHAIQDTQKQLSLWEEEGWVQSHAVEYKMDVSLKNNSLVVNGRQKSFP